MDPELVVQTLNFHGQQLTKLWENERGAASLQTSSLRDLDYQVYQQRSKDLGFQERGKRVRMHQFIVDKAPQLFKAEKKPKDAASSVLRSQDEDFFPLVPPLESFCHFDKGDARANFFQSIKVGDVLIGQVQQKNFHGLAFRVTATEDSTILRDVRELAIKGSIHSDHLIPASDRKDGAFVPGDLIRCEVIDINGDSEKLVCGMKGVHQSSTKPALQLGIISKEQLPKSYRTMVELTGKSYEESLQSNRTFRNPSAIEHLSNELGLHVASTIPNSFLKGLNAPFAKEDFADELRKSQNGKWAKKSVAEGISYFKAGLETEAFQCLNKALHIDPANVDGLTARGALYANNGSYEKAIADFELGLKEQPNHVNATNYLAETLVAYAKQFEEAKNITSAIQQYEKCLNVNPNHKDARTELQRLTKGRPKFNIDLLGVENGSKASGKSAEDLEKDEERKSRRHRKRGKRGSSSSSSKSGSSSSSHFSSSGSDSSRGRSRSKKSKKSKKSKREASLSPFSKKMAQLNPSSAATSSDMSVPAGQSSLYPSTEYPAISTQPHPVPPPAFGALGGNPPPPGFPSYSATGGAAPGQVGYEKEVQQFIQRTALNEEYEKKVELFLQRVGKGGKEGDKKEEKEKEKDKKKKKKKDRSKDKKKKDGKRDKTKEKKHKKKRKGSDDEDSDKQLSPNLSGLDELGELEAKLSAVYSKLAAKESSKKKKKRKRHSSNSSDSSSSSGSSSDSELERKKRKAKKALEDLAAAAGLLRGGEAKLNAKPEPVPPPYGQTSGITGMSATGGASGDEDDYPGKWRPMALKVKLGRGSDEPEVEESRMVYMKEEKRAALLAPVEPEEELPPGEDKVSFKIQSFGLFGPGPRPAAPKPVSPPKAANEQSQSEANQEKERGSRSRSRTPRRRSRSRSQSRSRSRGKSYSRSGSRSRSRSGSYRRRRSRSHSGERRHHAQRYRGGNRHPNQNYHHRGGRYPQRGGFQNRGRGWNNNYNNNRGGYNNRPYHNRPYHNNNNNQGGYDNRRHRGRNRGGYWQQQMQRSYSRSRSRSRSRTRSRSRSYSRSASRSPSRSRSRSRQDRGRGRDASPNQDQHRNDRQQSGERERSPLGDDKPAPAPVPPPSIGLVAASSSQSDRRKVGSKWDDGGGGGDDDEDLVPPGCE